MKPLVCDLPYPSIKFLTKDARSGNIISFAYATQKGELTSVLQYTYHKFFMEKKDADFARTLMQIAAAEMKHLDILGGAMLKLGVNPEFLQYPNSRLYYNASAVSKSTLPQKIISDDIQGELDAIANYQKMLFVLKNEQVEAIIKRIILDEQLHLETLKKYRKNIERNGRF
ncbi:MAG: hypothetical protein NC099_03810 [Corallococcus sp.]|nr:hypothetical protein [Corallococcus sp.]